MINKALFVRWLKEENVRLVDKGKRRYLHFDARIPKLGEKKAIDILDPDKVVRRFFYPFIQRIEISRTYKKDANGKKIIRVKKRPIAYASHIDAIIFSWYGFLINQLYEAQLNKLSINEEIIAYRSPGKATYLYVSEVLEAIKRKEECVALNFDIEGFFENIEHKLLKQKWVSILNTSDKPRGSLPDDHYAVFRAITRYSYIPYKQLIALLNIDMEQIMQLDKICTLKEFKKIREGNLILKKEDRGIAQGNSMSAVLSNLYMLDFDMTVSQYVKTFGGFYRRYSDDIIILANKENFKEVIVFIENEIKKLKLSIQTQKTEITFIKKEGETRLRFTDINHSSIQLQYLGIVIDDNGMYLRGRTIARYSRRIGWAINRQKKMAYKYNTPIARRRIYKSYVHPSKRGFRAYAEQTLEVLGSDTLKKQINRRKVISRILRSTKEKSNK